MSFTGLFLQSLAVDSGDAPPLVFIMALVATLGLLFFLVLLGVVYIYLSFAYFAIAKKAHLSTPGLAWIPFVGPLIIAYQTSKMHWWPWLLIIGYFIPFIGFLTGLAFAVFTVIWHWKMFEKIGRLGWWSILMLIPIVGFILIGIAAWSKK